MTAPTGPAVEVDLLALVRERDAAHERQKVAEREYVLARLRLFSAIRNGRARVVGVAS